MGQIPDQILKAAFLHVPVVFESAAFKGMHAAFLPHSAQCESRVHGRVICSVEAPVHVTATYVQNLTLGRQFGQGCRGESEEQQPKGGQHSRHGLHKMHSSESKGKMGSEGGRSQNGRRKDVFGIRR